MIGDKQGIMLNKYIEDYVLYDLETTGISVQSDEVIEIAAVKVRKGEIVEEFSELVNPGKPIPYAASRVNNITDDMVKKAPTFEVVLKEFIEFAGANVLVGHNIHTFDMKFIYRACKKYYGKTITNDYIDTLNLAKICFPNWKHRRLGDLADYYGISTAGAHRALEDCRMNQKIFEMLGKELEGKGSLGSKPNTKVCPRCKQPLKKRTGKYGEFFGCMGFPNCRYTENL